MNDESECGDYGEPWEIEISGAVAMKTDTVSERCLTERMVECVNLFEGIEDPTAYLEKLRFNRERFREEHENAYKTIAEMHATAKEIKRLREIEMAAVAHIKTEPLHQPMCGALHSAALCTCKLFYLQEALRREHR